jgi:energy-coupling factor transporter ATP-binding protein EcfA2
MRITEIEIKNFRGFFKAHPINLHKSGKNAIIYGENGSGKSSLFLAIKHFLSSSAQKLSFSDNRHLKADPRDSAYIKLKLDNGKQYEWSESILETDQPEILSGYKFSAFLAYRDILETHYLSPKNNRVNLFTLLISFLIADIDNNAVNPPITFSQHWKKIQAIVPTDRRKTGEIQKFQEEIAKFNDGINAILGQLTTELRAIFNYFEYGNIQLNFEPANLSYNISTKSIDSEEIILNVKFLDIELRGQHPQYLNEAKLSAIGIAIYLAALKLKPLPAGDLAILVLDDVLIGLDMANRLPIIDIIDNHFTHYQIFLMTYDREWFEILCEHFVESDKTNWKAFEFYCADDAELELPIFAERSKGRDEYIKRAEKYYQENDFKAAAVYTRSAYEAILKFFCNKYSVPIPYRDKPKNLKADEIWTEVKKFQRKGTTVAYVTPKTASAIDKAIRTVLNPLSHSRAVSTYRREVQYAIVAVKLLYSELK